jgi:hypothetical protein
LPLPLPPILLPPLGREFGDVFLWQIFVKPGEFRFSQVAVVEWFYVVAT